MLASLMNRLAAASLFVAPAATRRKTSSSRGLSCPPCGAADLVGEAAGHGGGQDGLAAAGGEDGAGQVGGRGVFQEVAGGARFQRGQDVGVERGQHQHPGARPGQAADGGHAVHAGHAQVHQDDVRRQLPGQAYGLLAVARLPHHHDPALGVTSEGGAQAVAHDRVIVGYQHPHGHGRSPSSAISTRTDMAAPSRRLPALARAWPLPLSRYSVSSAPV
ncbi:hypothetical protein GCM10020001_027950 [Nonomuraea salmonea]